VSILLHCWERSPANSPLDGYDLRRLRLHGHIERIPKTHRYRITAKGLRAAIFYTRLYNRSLRTGLAIVSSHVAASELPMAAASAQPRPPSTHGMTKQNSPRKT